MGTPKTMEERVCIIKPLYELLSAYGGVQKFRTYDGGMEFHILDEALGSKGKYKIFGYIDNERIIHMRIKPLPSGVYPTDSVLYEEQGYKVIDPRDPFDKEYILEEIQKASSVALES